MKVIEAKGKLIMWLSVLELKQELLAKLGWLFHWIERKEIMKSLILCLNKTALNQTASCSCGMFNRTGILCAHGLKVLDLMNIKILPTHYVLKKWTRDACCGSILDREGRNMVENPKLETQLRYRILSHKFLNWAYKAANSPDCCKLIDNALDCLGTQLENLSTSAIWMKTHDVMSKKMLTQMCSKVINFSVLQSWRKRRFSLKN